MTTQGRQQRITTALKLGPKRNPASKPNHLTRGSVGLDLLAGDFEGERKTKPLKKTMN